MSTLRKKCEEIEKAEAGLRLGGGPAEIDRVHGMGKLTARERVEKLLDAGTFQEVDLWSRAHRTGFPTDSQTIPGDAVITGYGEVGGRPVYVWAQDNTVLGGTMAAIHIRKISTTMEKALRERVPIVGIYDSEGMRPADTIRAHGYYSIGLLTNLQTMSSGVIPQISLVMGPCHGGSALSAPLADFVFMTKGTSFMHMAAPMDSAASEQMGGAKMHAQKSGTCDVLADNDEDCIAKCRELLSFLPSSNDEKPPLSKTADSPERSVDELLDMVPPEPNKWFDMREVIKRVVDDGVYFETKRDYAANLTVGFARFAGQPVGIIANNSKWRAGCEDNKTADKQARFIRFCDAFNIPLVYFTDCPAFFPGVDEERQAILRHGTMIIHATSEATVPKINTIVRKLYGGSQLVMTVNWTKADRYMAWPCVERALLGAPALTVITFAGAMKRAKTPEEAEEIKQKGLKIMEERVKEFSIVPNEAMIMPQDTRKSVIKSLKVLANKKQERPSRKHDNMNL